MSLPGRRPTNQRRPIMTQRFNRLSHSISECRYHVVFCPKYRYRNMRSRNSWATRKASWRCGCSNGMKVSDGGIGDGTSGSEATVSVHKDWTKSRSGNTSKGKRSKKSKSKRYKGSCSSKTQPVSVRLPGAIYQSHRLWRWLFTSKSILGSPA